MRKVTKKRNTSRQKSEADCFQEKKTITVLESEPALLNCRERMAQGIRHVGNLRSEEWIP